MLAALDNRSCDGRQSDSLRWILVEVIIQTMDRVFRTDIESVKVLILEAVALRNMMTTKLLWAGVKPRRHLTKEKRGRGREAKRHV